MRVSDQQIVSLMQYQMSTAYDAMAQAQTVLATGKQISTPADNPIGTAVALELQGKLAQNNSFTATASDTLSWLQTTDTALGGVGDALTQARTLAVQGANDTLTSDERQALASNVSQLLQQAVQSANGSYEGHFVLSGFQTGTQPFVLSGSGSTTSVAYQGDSGVIQREISPGQLAQVNTPGNTALPPVFTALINLQNDLQSGNTANIGGADLQAIDQAHDGLLLAQTTVGSRTNGVQAAQSSLQNAQVTISGQLSGLVDADMAQAAINFSTTQAAYQATLSAAAKAVQPSLLEFLK